METRFIVGIILVLIILAILVYFIGVSQGLFKNLFDWFGGLI